MNGKLRNILLAILKGVLIIALAEFVALLMNLSGDCGPGVQRCGETARLGSFVVLGVGIGIAICIVFRAVTSKSSKNR